MAQPRIAEDRAERVEVEVAVRREPASHDARDRVHEEDGQEQERYEGHDRARQVGARRGRYRSTVFVHWSIHSSR
jgi:hypothetical protein